MKDAPELEKMEYFMNPQGSLFKLTKGEYDFIMDMVREENQENPIGSEQAESYSKEDFLSEVYMTSEKYDSLKGLTKRILFCREHREWEKHLQQKGLPIPLWVLRMNHG